MIVLDASAILAFLHDEQGADRVEESLDESVVGAANWSEIAQKVTARGADWDQVKALLFSYDLRVEPVTEEDAERAATLWRSGSGLSLGDRLCLAMSHRLECPVLTADRAWGETADIEQLRD